LDADRQVASQLAADWNIGYRGQARVIADNEVTAEIMRTTNLVLVGDAATNKLVSRWAERLPVRYDADGFFVLDGSAYPVDKYGILFAAANPDFPDRSLVIATGMHDRLGMLPRSPLALAAAYALVATGRGVVAIDNFRTP
jgi:hypothetical protein